MIDFKHFKKLHSNEDSTTFVHKNGHKIVVAHSGIDANMKQKLADLPKFAKGGTVGLHADYSQGQKRTEVQENFTGKSSEIDAKSRKELEKSVSKKLGNRFVDLRLPTGMADGGEVLSLPENTSMGNFALNESMEPMSDGQMMSPMSSEQANSEQLENVQIPQPQTQQQPIPVSNGPNALDKIDSAYNSEAKAIGAQGQEQAQIAQKQVQDQEAMSQHYQQKSAQIDNERLAVYNDLKAAHVEPQHFLQSMSGFDRAMSAIGLILGGMGAGMTGTENQALAFLNKQIDRDIDAQKAELGRKENLLGHLNQEYGNLKDATTMTRAMQSDMYATKMLEVAERSKNPIALAKAQQMVQQMHLQYEPQMQEMKVRQAALAGMKTGHLNPGDAINYLVPKEDRTKATEEFGKHQMAQQSMKMVNDTLDKAFKINSTSNRLSNPVQSRAQLKAMEVNLLGVLKPIFNNFSETDKEQALANMPGLMDNEKTLANKKQNMENLIRVNLSTPTLDRYGIKLPESKQNKFTPR